MVYYFKFEAAPAESNRYYGKTGHGEANVFVNGAGCDNDLEAMEQIARAYVNAQLWAAGKLLSSFEPAPPDPDFDTDIAMQYYRALQLGVAGFFVASPDVDVPGGPTLRIRPY